MTRPRHKKALSPQSGWAMLPALFCIAIILSLIGLMNFGSSINGMTIRSIEEARELRELAKGEALSMAAGSEHLCSRRRVEFRAIPATYEICSEGPAPFITSPSNVPLPSLRVDYDALFSASAKCPNPTTPTTAPQSINPRAGMDCTAPSTMSGNLVVLDNIIGTSLTISPAGQAVSLVASPGGIELGTISLHNDTLIVAGGDVRIATLNNLSSEVIKVSIISSLGAIEVRSVSASLSLFVAGRSRLEVPLTPSLPPFPLPPFRHPSLYGFYSVTGRESL